MAARNEAEFSTGIWTLDTYCGSVVKCYADVRIVRDADQELKFAEFSYGLRSVFLYRIASNPSIEGNTGWMIAYVNNAGTEVIERYDHIQDATYFLDAAMSAIVETEWREGRGA